MFDSKKDVIDYIKKEGIQIVNILMMDIDGRIRQLSMPATRCDQEFLAEGFGFDASNYGFKSVENSDMVVIPDIKTAFLDPFRTAPTLNFLSEVWSVDDGERRFTGDLRHLAERCEEEIKKSTGGGVMTLGPEYEFYLFSDLEYDVLPGFSRTRIEPVSWNGKAEDKTVPSLRNLSHYHMAGPGDLFADFRDQAILILEDIGVEIKYHHHEVGELGQLEIETGFGGIRQMADATLLIKYVIQNLARQSGYYATFMPKPIHGQAGSGHHVHMKLTGGETEYPFSNEANYAGLSDGANSFIAGILQHAPGLCGLTNPSTNSYKRLVEGYEAPTAICYALSNRSAAIRIPGYVKTAQDRRFEYRPPDATANPYLAYSGLVLAGLSGYQQKLDPIKLGFGPVDQNIETLPLEQRKKINWLPHSLGDALTELENDHAYLIDSGVFTKPIIDSWLGRKRKELHSIRQWPHPREFQLYADL